MLRRLFDVVVREAERNPALAQELARAVGQQPQQARPPPASGRAFDASQLHAVNILRLHGEGALRGRLEQVKAVEDLRGVAKASGLLLSGLACRPRAKRAELIDGIIDAAKHYDAQRRAATA
jgi:hypothetical protein